MMIPASLISMLALATGSAPVGPMGMPPQASTVAAEIDFLYQVITWICAFFFVLITGLIIVFMIKYSKPPGTKAETLTVGCASAISLPTSVSIP